MVTGPASLREDALAPLWQRVKQRLDSKGHTWRGRMQLPTLSVRGHHLVESLVGHKLGRTVDLGRLECALAGREVGSDLPAALDSLGHPLSASLIARRQRRADSDEVRDIVEAKVDDWPEPWANEWLDVAWRSGAFRGVAIDTACRFLADVRAVLDAVAREKSWSRTQLAAEVLGSSHALDRGTRLEAMTYRALGYLYRLDLESVNRNQVWDTAGAPVDTVSYPVLTWGLPAVGSGPVDSMCRSATVAGLPLHISVAMLRRCPVTPSRKSTVVVVENPRIVEAAAERRSANSMICTNGNPTLGVWELLAQLRDHDIELRYHGDFDTAGLAIAARMHANRCTPWKMSTPDYLEAIDVAHSTGVVLPIDDKTVPKTPWDPQLAIAFGQHRRVVHEERVVDILLSETPTNSH